MIKGIVKKNTSQRMLFLSAEIKLSSSKSNRLTLSKPVNRGVPTPLQSVRLKYIVETAGSATTNKWRINIGKMKSQDPRFRFVDCKFNYLSHLIIGAPGD